MITLSTKKGIVRNTTENEPFVIRASTNKNLPLILRKKEVFLVHEDQNNIPIGFKAYAFFDCAPNVPSEHENIYVLPSDLDHLGDGDVLRIDPNTGSVRVLYRRLSKHNSFLTTERCNSFCLMCSQPPRKINDDYLIDEILAAIPLIDRGTGEIGLSGGEPTLLGDRFFELVKSFKNFLPETSLHILTNGRLFEEVKNAEKISEINHHDLMLGIPLYSDISNIHDFVVQADGAYDETIRGILNLKAYDVRVEIRVVIHNQTYERLPQLANFIARNLTFVDHVAFMGLEMMGFTKTNLNVLWVDPIKYQDKLEAAVTGLDRAGIRVSIYNHQLCLLKPSLYPFSVKSISDWKNEYISECDGCLRKEECGGFFTSAAMKYSDHITPFTS